VEEPKRKISLQVRNRQAIFIPFVGNVALATLRLEDFEETSCLKKPGKALHAIIAWVDWCLPLRSTSLAVFEVATLRNAGLGSISDGVDL
jgi:hypothetical protein